MANVENPKTDALQLVQPPTTVHGFWRILGQTVTFEDGFSLELFRGGTHLGSILSGQAQQTAQMKQRFQALGAKEGDTLYRVNLGPRMQLIQHSLRTYDGYTRDYAVTAELQVIDSSEFIKLYRQGADPVNLVILGIKETLQEYGDRTLYEKMRPASIQTQAKYAFDKEPSNLRAGIRINRTYQPSLSEDKNYQPINLSPLLDLKGKLTTLEGYVRDYEVKTQLQITDPQQYKYLEYTGAAPLELARTAIDSELQRYARQEFYETLSELQLHDVVEHAFDKLPGQVNSGLKIVRSHRFSLGEDKNYQPINRSPLLSVDGKLTTLEGYACPYKVTVELQVNDLRVYLQLDREGAAPLNLARAAIDGELQRYACQESYETLSELQLHNVVEHAFDKLSSRVTGGMQIVCGHRFSLDADPDYINLGHRTLVLTNTLATADHYECEYEINVELEVDKPQEFVRLTRQGNDPLNHVRVAIEGAIHLATKDKMHDELPSVDLHQVVHSTFANAPDSTIVGLKIVKAHKVSLKVDPRIQEEADIIHRTRVEAIRAQRQAELADLENKLDFESAKQVEDQEITLAQKRQAREKAEYLFGLEKDSVEEAHRLRKALSQWAYSQWVERAGEALQANVPVQSIVEEMSTLSRALQSGLPQVSEPTANNQLPAGNALGGVSPAQSRQLSLGATESGQDDTLVVEVPSPPKRNKIKNQEWGLTLVEVRLPIVLRDLLDDQDQAFQVWEVTEGGLAQAAGFQETDILIKINGQHVYTNEAFDRAFDSLQPGEQIKILVLREETRKSFTLTHPKSKEQDLENTLEQ